LLAFVTIGVLTHNATLTAWILAVGVRALIVGHFSVAFYLVALGFTAAFIALGRTLVRWRSSS
jgi:hypothetical protein